MAGSISGGKKAATTNKKKYGDDFYITIGAKGGSKLITKPKGFAYDSRTFWQKLFRKPSHAALAGRKGGAISKRGPKETTWLAKY